MLRLVTHRPFLLRLAFMAVTAGFMIAFLVLDGVVWRVTPGWPIAVGTGALAAGMIGATARRRAHGTDNDPVTSPFAPTGRVAEDQAPRFRTALLAFALHPAALIPTWTLVMLAVTWRATR